MRILHVYKDYYPVLGGVENIMRVLAESHAAGGHDVTALVCNCGFRSTHSDIGGVKVVKVGRLTTAASMPISLRQVLSLVGQHPDVIHVHTPYPLGELGVWLLKRRIPYVITYHSDVVRQQGWLRLYSPILRQVLRSAARIMPTSSQYIETSPWLAPVRDLCTVVPLGVDPMRFAPPEELFDGPPTLLFVGRLRYYKGLGTLIEVLPHLPDVALKIVGTGPMEAEWRALVTHLGLSDRVSFLGQVADADLPAVYHQAHLFVLPSNARAEAFGVVLLEAMASGLPCISTEVGTGTSWVVQDGVTGRVVPPEDPTALATAVRDLLSVPARLRIMGQASRQRVENEFTLDRLSERVMSVYRDVA